MADLSHKVLTRIYDPHAQACLDDTHQLQADLLNPQLHHGLAPEHHAGYSSVFLGVKWWGWEYHLILHSKAYMRKYR